MDHRPAPTADRLLSIHYLRAIAAIMVIVYHVFSHRLVPVPNAGAVVWLKQGVGIFFVISGYVMVSSTARGDVSAGRFLWRRLRRIAPIYWVATAACLFGMTGVEWSHVVGSFLFLPVAAESAGTFRSPVLDVGWTLNFEMAFYVAFAASLLLPRRAGFWMLIAAIVTISVVPAFDGLGLLAYYFQPFPLDFAVGMVIARLGLIAPRWCLPLGFAGLAILPQLTDIWALCVTLPAGLIVASALAWEGRLRSWKAPVLLGDASYSLYLFHLMALQSVATIFGRFDSAGHAIWITGWCIAVGVAAHLYLEKPLAAFLARFRFRFPATARPSLT